MNTMQNTNHLGFQRAGWRERIYELGTLPNRATALLVIPNAPRNLESTTLSRLDALEAELVTVAREMRLDAAEADNGPPWWKITCEDLAEEFAR